MRPEANVLYRRRCIVCDEAFTASKRTARCCPRKRCRAQVMDIDALLQVMGIVHNARWAGAPSQEELRREYYQWQMRDAVKQLEHSVDLLSTLLVEILEDLEGHEDQAGNGGISARTGAATAKGDRGSDMEIESERQRGLRSFLAEAKHCTAQMELVNGRDVKVSSYTEMLSVYRRLNNSGYRFA
jgi:hypothetical protein